MTSVLVGCLVLSLFCSAVAALSDAGVMQRIVSLFFPPLKGVNVARIVTVARVAWYVAFTAALLHLSTSVRFARVSYMLGILQIHIIFWGGLVPLPFHRAGYYNDSLPSWERLFHVDSPVTFSWREFYDERLFGDIKRMVSYNEEPVCSVGLDPSGLLYNGFTAIDGYTSVYPREQQLRWHELLKPEFDRNPYDMKYFDSWGGRRYVYNKDLPTGSTRMKYRPGANLYIDIGMLKEHYRCRYLFSAAELMNAADMGLKLVGNFSYPESIYSIWVYELL